MDEVFHLKAPFQPTGDQPQAIEALVQGIHEGEDAQTLLGVTGSGKTFTMANIIARCNRPTLILEPNKTLASQICTEMRGFFPDDAVEYFVSYYDYYQPEAYVLAYLCWLLVWHCFASHLIGVRLYHVIRDILPYFLITLSVLGVLLACLKSLE